MRHYSGFHNREPFSCAQPPARLCLLYTNPHPGICDVCQLNRPVFPGECFICELRLPAHHFRWKHNTLFLPLTEGCGPALPVSIDCYTSPPT
ncbi:hypothetical protein HMPREF9534_02370 [Escherichia coli MS 69-1]|nr:hypothetical protein HMPREF9534_02370 [Escherichia coli MS 69-1]